MPTSDVGGWGARTQTRTRLRNAYNLGVGFIHETGEGFRVTEEVLGVGGLGGQGGRDTGGTGAATSRHPGTLPQGFPEGITATPKSGDRAFKARL